MNMDSPIEISMLDFQVACLPVFALIVGLFLGAFVGHPLLWTRWKSAQKRDNSSIGRYPTKPDKVNLRVDHFSRVLIAITLHFACVTCGISEHLVLFLHHFFIFDTYLLFIRFQNTLQSLWMEIVVLAERSTVTHSRYCRRKNMRYLYDCLAVLCNSFMSQPLLT